MIKKVLIVFIFALVIGFTALSPIIVSVITGNWWFLLMYSFVWLYVVVEKRALEYILECDLKAK